MVRTVTWAHIEDVGTFLEVEFLALDGTAKDISSATTKLIRVEKTDGTKVNLTADFTTDGTDGKLRHLWATDELNQSGVWKVQGRAEGAGFVFSTERGLLRVRSIIDP